MKNSNRQKIVRSHSTNPLPIFEKDFPWSVFVVVTDIVWKVLEKYWEIPPPNLEIGSWKYDLELEAINNDAIQLSHAMPCKINYI